MKNLTKTAVVVLATFAISSSIYAQSSANATVNVAAQLKKGLAISHEAGDLDFSEIVLTSGATGTTTINEENGAKLLITGHPNKDVTVTFGTVTLDNNSWVSTNGGTEDDIVFTPSVEQTGSSSTYASAANLASEGTVTLPNVSGDGTLYLWVGGSIAIAADQAQGDYTGTFSLTVEY